MGSSSRAESSVPCPCASALPLPLGHAVEIACQRVMPEEQQEHAHQQQAEARDRCAGTGQAEARSVSASGASSAVGGSRTPWPSEWRQGRGSRAARCAGRRAAEARWPAGPSGRSRWTRRRGRLPIQAHALSLRRHTEGIDKRRDGLRHAAGHCIERSRQGQALLPPGEGPRSKAASARRRSAASGGPSGRERSHTAARSGCSTKPAAVAPRRAAAPMALSRIPIPAISLRVGNQNAMDAPQGDLHQGIEPGRSFHCVASCEKYQAVSRSTTTVDWRPDSTPTVCR